MPRPTIQVLPDPLAVARAAADVVARVIQRRPTAALALPTGRTPVPLYAELVERFRAGRIDFGRVRGFNLDEWVGVAPTDAGSYAAFMERYFYSGVNVPPANRFIPNGIALDLEEECQRYEAAIRAAGGIDLAILGIGNNGHIGFNEPGTPFSIRTHVAVVAEETRRANAYSFADGRVPERAITVGIATILDATEILLLATGPEKAEALARALDGPIDPAIPASALQRHPRVNVIADAAAAQLIARRD